MSDGYQLEPCQVTAQCRHLQDDDHSMTCQRLLDANNWMGRHQSGMDASFVPGGGCHFLRFYRIQNYTG